MAQTYKQYGPLLSLVWAGEQGVAAAFKADNVRLISRNLRTSSLKSLLVDRGSSLN